MRQVSVAQETRLAAQVEVDGVNGHGLVVAVQMRDLDLVYFLQMVCLGDGQHGERRPGQVDAVEGVRDAGDVVLLDGVHSVEEAVDFAGADGFDDVPAAGVRAQDRRNAVHIVGEDEVVL